VSHENGPAVIQRPRAASRAADLSVVVACRDFVCAISTRHVTRLALNDEVDGANSFEGVVLSGQETLASFNLGVLLGMSPLTAAWVFLSVPYEGGSIPIALRTGTCLFVRNIAVEAPLPDGLFTSRGKAVLGAFVAGDQLGLDDASPYGLALEIERLWTDKELHTAKTILGRLRGKVQRD
jgi:hypothetical protein